MDLIPDMDRVKKTYKKVTSAIGSAAKTTGETISQPYYFVSDKLTGVSLPFLSNPELLDWSEKITKGTATIYDKALDMEYLKTHIGGGNHRMFDGGHDLVNAWDRVKDASQDDTLQHEVIEYVTAIWKDVTTKMGLPLFTWNKTDYDNMSKWVSENIPFIDKDYMYDLLSFDVFEVIGSALGAVAFLFALNKGDQKKLAEILGSMGITTIASANPIMAIVVVFLAGYAYFIKKHEFEKEEFVKGAAIASTSVVIFAILGLPLLIELGIVIVVTMLVRKHIVDNAELQLLIKHQVVLLGDSTVKTAKKFQKNVAELNDKLVDGLKEKTTFLISWIPYGEKNKT